MNVTIDQAMQLGIERHRAGDLRGAESIYRQVLGQQPDHANALNLLGVIAAQIGWFDDAIELIRRAIALGPGNPGFHNNLANALQRKGLCTEAVEQYREAIRLKPDSAEAYNNLSTALRDIEAFDEAIAACEAAVRLRPDFAEAYNNLGCSLMDVTRQREAIGAFDKCISLRGDHWGARYNRSRAYLVLGNWQEGWREFDARLKLPELKLNRGFSQPQWDGSDPTGKTILLHAEGGHGDAINFVRFVPELAKRGGRWILECQAGLVSLFERVEGIERVIARGEGLPAFDWQLPLQGLPGVLGITVENVPSGVPYLSAGRDVVERWGRQIGEQGKFRVGLVWAGSRHAGVDARTRRIDVFAPLAAVSGVRFYGMQVGEDANQAPPLGMDFVDVSRELSNFGEAAGLIENLDLVIGVDTSVVHLAGALGKPVWVLIPLQGDFRWLLEREDTPWYPTMRLFRQKVRGDWSDPVGRMKRSLEELAR